VFDIIEQENVKITKDQLAKLLVVLKKEKVLENEEELKKTEKQSNAL
jgi:hypothetical protein